VEALALMLCAKVPKEIRECGNCNESFDGFHGRIP
jgi:hypothetical protein